MPIKGSFGAASARAFRAMLSAFTSFSDNFNRTSSGELGTSSSGGAWKALKGTWGADGSSAITSDSANTYPIANVEMSSSNVTASITTGPGLKIISANGTVGSIGSGDGTTGVSGFHWATITNMSTTTGIQVGDWISASAGTGTIYGGTPDYVEVTEIVNTTSIKYRIKGGTVPTAGTIFNISSRGKDGGSGLSLWITDSGNWFGVSYGRSIDTSCNCNTCQDSYCNTYTNYSSSYNVYNNYGSTYSYCNYSPYTTYNCSSYATELLYSCLSTSYQYICPGGFSNTYTTGCNAWYSSWACSTWYSSAPCSTWSSSSPCSAWSSAYKYLGSYASKYLSYSCTTYKTTYSCSGWKTTSGCSGWTGPTSNCYGYGYSVSGSTCGGGYAPQQYCSASYSYYSYTCPPGWTQYNGVTCSSISSYTAYSPAVSGTYTAYAPQCSSTTYAYVPCNCQTCYPPYISVIKSSSNAITEVARWSLSSMAAAVKIITDSINKKITVRPYKDKEMTSQIGSDLTHTDSSAIITSKFGIILTPSDYMQGSSIDDFNIDSN